MASIPLHPGRFFWGALKERRDQPLKLFSEAAAKYGDIVQLQMGPEFMGIKVVLISKPEYIHYVFQTNAKNYVKGQGYRTLENFLGKGLLTSEGEHWRSQRKLAQPAFHQKSLMGMASTMVNATTSALSHWRAGQPRDIAREMMRLTLRIAGETLFSADVSKQEDVVGSAVSELIQHSNNQLLSLVPIPLSVPTPANVRAKRLLRELTAMMDELIAARRANKKPPHDLLSMLMSSVDEETGGKMSDAHLRDEIITLFVAGHETTAQNLSWTFFLLAKNPEWEKRAVEEVRMLDANPGFEDLPKLSVIRRVVMESMRLYPPAWAISRDPLTDDHLGDYEIKKGTIVIASQYVMHRHPKFWTDPDKFDPDRFLPENEKAIPKHVYFPFGIGPRSCIGNQFAMMEAQLILATILRKFRLELVLAQTVEPEALITLRPKGGLRMIPH